MDQFMKRAVELALNNVEEGGGPFGAVLVKDDKLISAGVTELHLKYDISGHAEMIAIRKAQEQLQTIDLKGYTMYASGEPCPMCLAAAYWSRVDRIWFACTREDAAAGGFDDSFLYDELTLPITDRHLPMKSLLRKEGLQAFAAWKASAVKIPY